MHNFFISILIHSTKSLNSPHVPNKRGTPLPDKNINLLLLGWFCDFLFIDPKSAANRVFYDFDLALRMTVDWL